MQKTILLIACISLAGASSAGEFLTKARVIDSTPIIETVYEEYEACHYETRRNSSRRSSSNTGDKLLVGLLGGATGSAFGKGSGKDAATAAGAVLGSSLADGDGLSEGELLGGVVGGIIGNQLGKGGGKTAATGAGALIGAIVGDNLQRGTQQPRSAGTSTKQRVCEIRERAKKVITGYDVTYEYDGVRSIGQLSYRPGEYVDINVGVDLVEDRTSQLQ
ncbi:MAG: glycine zipper 2TM domain-containing protein [Gammaproteobacteria bacterium WSBS_2016_MAG_OTU1]